MEQAHRCSVPPFAFKENAAPFIGTEEIDEVPARDIGIRAARRAHGKGLVRSPDTAFAANHRGQNPSFGQRPAASASNHADHVIKDIRLQLRLELP